MRDHVRDALDAVHGLERLSADGLERTDGVPRGFDGVVGVGDAPALALGVHGLQGHHRGVAEVVCLDDVAHLDGNVLATRDVDDVRPNDLVVAAVAALDRGGDAHEEGVLVSVGDAVLVFVAAAARHDGQRGIDGRRRRRRAASLGPHDEGELHDLGVRRGGRQHDAIALGRVRHLHQLRRPSRRRAGKVRLVLDHEQAAPGRARRLGDLHEKLRAVFGGHEDARALLEGLQHLRLGRHVLGRVRAHVHAVAFHGLLVGRLAREEGGKLLPVGSKVGAEHAFEPPVELARVRDKRRGHERHRLDVELALRRARPAQLPTFGEHERARRLREDARLSDAGRAVDEVEPGLRDDALRRQLLERPVLAVQRPRERRDVDTAVVGVGHDDVVRRGRWQRRHAVVGVGDDILDLRECRLGTVVVVDVARLKAVECERVDAAVLAPFHHDARAGADARVFREDEDAVDVAALHSELDVVGRTVIGEVQEGREVGAVKPAVVLVLEHDDRAVVLALQHAVAAALGEAGSVRLRAGGFEDALVLAGPVADVLDLREDAGGHGGEGFVEGTGVPRDELRHL